MEDAHKRMAEEYYSLSRAINKGINELGSMGSSSVTRSSTPTMAPSTLSRILAEVDMDLAEAEGQVSVPFPRTSGPDVQRRGEGVGLGGCETHIYHAPHHAT
jgi:hypothetical protein